ncbi:MAG: PilZ domain-containing protein [Candidatus Omnitrophota bacterium]
MNTVDERRISKRIAFKEAVRYELKDPAYFRGCVAYDLSETGVRLRLAEFLPINTELVLNIQLRGGSFIEYTGRIAWISQIPFMDHYQVGVEFFNPSLAVESQKKMRQLIYEN